MLEWDVFWKFIAQFSILFLLFTFVWLVIRELRKETKKD